MLKYVYVDFESYKTSDDVIKYIDKRIEGLKNIGFENKEVFKIIFSNMFFKDNFIDDQYFHLLKRQYKRKLKIS